MFRLIEYPDSVRLRDFVLRVKNDTTRRELRWWSRNSARGVDESDRNILPILRTERKIEVFVHFGYHRSTQQSYKIRALKGARRYFFQDSFLNLSATERHRFFMSQRKCWQQSVQTQRSKLQLLILWLRSRPDKTSWRNRKRSVQQMTKKFEEDAPEK